MHQSMQLRVCLQNSSDSKYTLHTWPPDKSKTANLPAEIAFKPIFHHLSLSSCVLSSNVDTLLSGTGSMAAAGSPESSFINMHARETHVITNIDSIKNENH